MTTIPADLIADLPDVPDTKFEVTDPGSLEWTLRKVAKYRGEIAEATRLRDEWVRQIDDWYQTETGKAESSAAFFVGLAEGYMRRVLDETDGKTKSVSVPSGKVASTTRQPAVVIDDENELIAWVETQIVDGFLPVDLVKRKVLVTDLRKHVKVRDTADGPVVDFGGEALDGVGLGVSPGSTSISVTTT